MIHAEKADKSRSSIAALSRSVVGRAVGTMSRLVQSASTIQKTGVYLRRQIWSWPIIAAVLLGISGWWVNKSVSNAMREQRATDLNVMVDASVSSLRVWLDEQRINAQLFADDEQLRPLVADLIRIADGTPASQRLLSQAEAQELIRNRLQRRIEVCGYSGYFLVDKNGVVIAADQDTPIGKALNGYRREVFNVALTGKSTVSKPFRSPLLLADEKGELRANLPTMFATAPILDKNGKPIAALGVRIRPEDRFTRILQVVRFGESGETYAFDRNGLMLSQSRFDDQMKEIGLLADQPDVKSILTIEIRDPQVNMPIGERPAIRRADQPLTKLAADALENKSGYDADGYRDYRGSPTVGAWRWMDDYDIGIGTEVDASEAFRPVLILSRAFWVLMILLFLSAIGIFIAMLYISRQHRALQKASLQAKQLGQYALEQKLGAGGMGTVYKARHAMLRRPTAVKLLDIERMSDEAISRFEREVQLTSSLTHPNTVAVFDYGRTPEGIFYYAMEYLDGVNLDDLVKQYGVVSEARLIYILKQACGALAEAHAADLIHRDIKPANIFLTSRGGLHDFVKVLDFGLVKALDDSEQAHLTNPNAVTGTPLYLSPEGISQPGKVDARADVYALAAVGYFLLTGTPVFTGDTVMEICMKHVKNTPEAPSVRCGKPFSVSLETLLLQCLAKSPSDRPNNAAELLIKLEACEVEGKWTSADAAVWWANSAKSVKETSAATVQTPVNQVTANLDMTMAFQGDTEIKNPV